MNEKAETSPIIRGCWQLASDHSDQCKSVEPITDAFQLGFHTFDCADIYSGVEELLGKAIKALDRNKIKIHTKFVPDLSILKTINHQYVEKIIDRSLLRLGVEQLDLVQFHWWDWEIKNYLPTMESLKKLKAAGKIAKIGLTNVNTAYLEELSDRFELFSLQAQVSLFDRRVERGTSALCQKRGIKILGYGSLLGGFVSEKWLGSEEPELKALKNRSLVKYKLLIDSACGWKAFQLRLSFLKVLGIKYGCDIANIAIAALIQGKKAEGIIAGLSPTNYLSQNRALAQLPLLEKQDLQMLTAWSCELEGDAYDAERDKNSLHAKIMKYDLNA